MAVEANKLARFTAAIGCGHTKDTYPLDLTPEEADAWDRIADESAALKAKGLMIDVPSEWPDPDDDDGPEPAAAAPAPEAPAPAPAPAAPPA